MEFKLKDMYYPIIIIIIIIKFATSQTIVNVSYPSIDHVTVSMPLDSLTRPLLMRWSSCNNFDLMRALNNNTTINFDNDHDIFFTHIYIYI